MANAKKCDRCGEFYTENTYTKGIYNNDVIVGFQYLWSDGSTGEMIDLCDDCQRDFDTFMKWRRKDEETTN